ncbi:c(7)-type cytochrome triheme domain-containing protein [Thalassotalea sp. G2M2-11]|uniref:c(7)-type cytochrome triheme domain-containing protein n=1 Tax=Thalassotalea sp. G2M2-11 TaxID=2787627 RepID=UPI0019D177A4|nr:c(7)-type cytochrome triheme domain-containing protein [Thalassotalea sp. G2M2-11]
MFKILSCLLLILLQTSLWADDRVWLKIIKDGNHDLDNASVSLLQNPEDVFKGTPPDFASIGNQVDWVRALETEAINPRSQLFETTDINVLDLDIIMEATGEMPLVRFPHKAHTEWLDCSNCHDQLFKKKAGGNPVNMFAILAGEYCGRCHGAVAFPLTECRRCHSESRKTFKGKPGAQPVPGKKYAPVTEQKVVK